MITRFFKRDKAKGKLKSAPTKPAKKSVEGPAPLRESPTSKGSALQKHRKILTAEGWKRLMLKKSSKSKK